MNIIVDEFAVAKQAQTSIGAEPELALMVQMNGPNAIASQAFPSGVIREVALVNPAYAARECSHPDVPSTIFHYRGNPIVRQTIGFPEILNPMTGKLVEPAFIGTHPHIPQVVLKHAEYVIVRGALVRKVRSYFVILHAPKTSAGAYPKAAIGVLNECAGRTLEAHFVTIVGQRTFFETIYSASLRAHPEIAFMVLNNRFDKISAQSLL